ncbi:MAG: hypothetical protein IPK77_16805 [Cellvibrio sp.]|nr:hypothetical protein [Cellvibrio sp.]
MIWFHQKALQSKLESSSYLQSWAQSKLSSVSFGIQPTSALDLSTNKYSEVRKRQADVYIFCVYSHKNQETANPLNIEHWEFYVIPTSVLNENCQNQKSISLAGLLKLNPLKPTIMKFTMQLLNVRVNKSLKHRALRALDSLSRSFVVLLRKSIPQNRNLKTAA